MLAFMDESGDTGFRFARNSSLYFVVTMVIIPSEEEAERIRLGIDALKAELGKPKMEFHFSGTDNRARQKFFDSIKPYQFQVLAAVCDKSQLLSLKDNHTGFLLSTFGAALEQARDAGLLNAANVKYDEAGGNAFQRKLASSLLAKVNGTENGKFIKAVEPQNSSGNNLIQMVDMICGVIARPYNKPQRREQNYLEPIKHHIYAVLEWP